MRTPWPLFSLSMLQADIIGALFVLGFLRYALPPEDRIQLQDLPVLNLAIFATALVVVFLAGLAVTLRLLMPVFRWQRRDNMLAEADPAATELARSRALRMPFYRTLISIVAWAIGSVVFIIASWSVARFAAPVVAVATGLGAAATSIIGYLQSERVLRPVAVAALRSGVPENVKAPGVILRQILTWMLSTAVPVLAIVLAVVADKIFAAACHAGEAVHPDPVAGGGGAGHRAGQHAAGGHVDRRSAAPAALGALGGAARKLQRAHADLRRQRAGPAAGGLQRHGARPVRAAAAA